MNRKGLSLFLATALALFLVPTLLSILGQAQTAHAATFTVNIFHDENDGICDPAGCSIRDAISAAGNGDDIIIPAGTYTLSATNGSLTVSESIIFNGNNSADTFIDAQGNSRVFHVTAGTVFLNNLTIQNGTATEGGGIRVSGTATNVTLNDSIVSDNTATTNGAGIFVIGGTANLNLINSTVISNNATTNGGGIYLQSGTAALQNSEVVTNTAVSGGGGIYIFRGSVTSDNSSISYNNADQGGGVFVNQDTASFTFNSGEIAFNTGNLTSTFPGGGLFVGSGTATLNGGEIKFNQAFRGGGVLVSSGQVTLNNAQIISNTASYGGGVYVRETAGWFTQTSGIIATNQSTAADFGGGGLYVFNGNAALLGGSVMTNTAIFNGGGMEVRFGTLLADGVTISDNQSGAMGGGIYNSGGNVTIQNSQISGNTSSNDGGGIATSFDTLPSQTLIENSAIIGNSAGSGNAGGGISGNNDANTGTQGGVITLTNVTVSGNSAGNGAGFSNELGSKATLTNVTISENSANNNGGGISNSSGTLTVGNSIIFNNSAPSGANCNGTITSAGNNVANTAECNGEIETDPLLQPLALNGGDTLNYALGSGSLAIDNGSTTLCPSRDQRGNLRPINGACDIGAYEDGIGFFISDASLDEGDAGSTQMSFTITRSFITSTAYTVTYATVDGTAVAGIDQDYLTDSDTLTFDPGDSEKIINIDILGDTLDEEDEQFTVELIAQSPETLPGNTTGTGTILDDDDPPSLTLDDVSIVEGSGTAVLTATLSTPSGKTITVDYVTMPGSAEADGDYLTAGDTITFTPGTVSQTIAIDLVTDNIDEFDETFTVELSNASNVTLADSSAQVTILDDDDPPTVSIAAASVTEGNSGTTDMLFTVSLSSFSGKPITVTYGTQAGTATAGVDYQITSGTLNFAPGEVAKIVAVPVIGDTIDEFDETFQVTLGTPGNSTILDGTAEGTILDDDPLPTATISDATVTEGDSGTVTAVFTVTLSAASEKTITINYSSANGTATAGEDYTAVSGMLTFNPGESLSQTISVTVQGDEVTEPDEQFFINLTGSNGNVTLSDNQAIGTILNDDGTFVYLPFVIKP